MFAPFKRTRSESSDETASSFLSETTSECSHYSSDDEGPPTAAQSRMPSDVPQVAMNYALGFQVSSHEAPRFTRIHEKAGDWRQIVGSSHHTMLDLFNGVIVALLARSPDELTAEEVARMLFTRDVESVSKCFNALAGVNGFIFGLQSVPTMSVDARHPYADSLSRSNSDLVEDLNDRVMLSDVRKSIEHRQYCDRGPGLSVEEANVVLMYRARELEDGEIDPMDEDSSYDDDDGFSSTPDMQPDPSKIAVTFAETLAMSIDKIDVGKVALDASLEALRQDFDNTLAYVSLVRQIDAISQISKREPRAMECLVANVIESMDDRLDDIRNVLRLHLGYTPADANGKCVICQSAIRDPVVLMCGHVLCNACVQNPNFPKDNQPFLDTPGVTCPQCKHQGQYVKLFL